VIVYLGFLAGVGMVCLGSILIILLWPPRVVELNPDPPEDAHFSKFTSDELKQRALDIQLFWLAWTQNEGKLSDRTLWAVVERWNRQYDRYPEYTNWIISRDTMRESVARYYRGVIPVPLRIKQEVEWFMVVPDGRSRCLQPLADFLTIAPEKEADVPDVPTAVPDVRQAAPDMPWDTPHLNGATSGN